MLPPVPPYAPPPPVYPVLFAVPSAFLLSAPERPVAPLPPLAVTVPPLDTNELDDPVRPPLVRSPTLPEPAVPRAPTEIVTSPEAAVVLESTTWPPPPPPPRSVEPPPPAPTTKTRTVVTPLGTVHVVVPTFVNFSTHSPVTTVIVTPVELPTVAVHTPDETVAALAEVEANPTVVETAIAKTLTSEMTIWRIRMSKSYS